MTRRSVERMNNTNYFVIPSEAPAESNDEFNSLCLARSILRTTSSIPKLAQDSNKPSPILLVFLRRMQIKSAAGSQNSGAY